MNIKLSFFAAAAVVAISLSIPAYAADEYNVSSGITTSGVPLGVHGVDTVALVMSHEPTNGEAVYTVVIDGVAYYFASAESASMFKAAPEKYMPQFGGFCAYAVALGKKFDGNPRFADIVGGKLYLFVSAAIFDQYKMDKENILLRADAMWPKIQHTAVDAL